jgi:signal transduction histidine kinase
MPSLTINGEKQLVMQAVANLLDNAIKYATPACGAREAAAAPAPASSNRAVISVRVEDRDEFAEIVVADRGPGVPPEDRERVFQRFMRLQPSRSVPGSGLGLSLVAAVARLHSGMVVLEDNQPGLRVRLLFAKQPAGGQLQHSRRS